MDTPPVGVPALPSAEVQAPSPAGMGGTHRPKRFQRASVLSAAVVSGGMLLTGLAATGASAQP
ncbi:MAG TPA: hypothetical protein H9871_06790, partial [Candidatus Nesterenkonia stercoripullorum]|nr:hypothetical protein [Candidatus Nesterenkonia stercoripullorum]